MSTRGASGWMLLPRGPGVTTSVSCPRTHLSPLLCPHVRRPRFPSFCTQVLIRVVKAVSLTNRQRLIEVFLRAVRLRFTRSRCVALSWLASLACAHLRPANCSQFANQSLAPVLELLAAEDEEDVHKPLAAALARLLPVDFNVLPGRAGWAGTMSSAGSRRCSTSFCPNSSAALAHGRGPWQHHSAASA